MTNELIVAYTATVISVSARFIFMYLLYTKKSTNIFSLIFSIMNIVSSALWITYSQMVLDMPLLIRGSCDLVLFSISSGYIMHNRLELKQDLENPARKILFKNKGARGAFIGGFCKEFCKACCH